MMDFLQTLSMHFKDYKFTYQTYLKLGLQGLNLPTLLPRPQVVSPKPITLGLP